MTVVRDAGYDTLPQGARVTCEVTDGQRGPVVSSILAVDATTGATGPAGGAEGGVMTGRDRGWGHDGNDRRGRRVSRGVVKFYNAAKGLRLRGSRTTAAATCSCMGACSTGRASAAWSRGSA